MELREGESSGLRRVWSCRPMVLQLVLLDMVDECLLCEMDQLPESRASRASDWYPRRAGLCSEGERELVREAMDGSAGP